MSITQLTLDALTQNAHPLLAAPNPFDGVVPNFSVFGLKFDALWKKILGGFWGLALIFCAFKLISAALKLQAAKKGGYSQGVMENTDDVKQWGMGTGIVVGAAVIFGAVVALIG